ncbi:peptidase [Verrucomicrobia bacterium SCGC AG-212-E04]|nr:peptidase [Verrucomicrobia bacterium SCGC AG-212-E04]
MNSGYGVTRGFNVWFMLIIFATFAISLWAQWRVKRTVHKYNQVPASCGLTGAQVAAHILQAANINDVEIVEGEGFLGDHYDPMQKRLVLSPDNFGGTSTAAIGISAHECGHALQHKVAYAPLNWRMAAVGATNFASTIVGILPWLGLMGGFFRGPTAFTIMAAGWGVIMAFNLITLPVEFDASNRAKLILGQMGFIQPGEETTAVNKVLNAAGFTYVAAFLTSLAYALWYLLPLLLGGRRSD